VPVIAIAVRESGVSLMLGTSGSVRVMEAGQLAAVS
jgi:hypothetical protein